MRKVIISFVILAVIICTGCSKEVAVTNPLEGKNTVQQEIKESIEEQEGVKAPETEEEIKGNKGTEETGEEKTAELPIKISLKEEKKDIPGNKVYYTGKAVVLTYHHISQKPVSSITIKPERFEADLKMLKDNYFNVITLRDMIKAMYGEYKLPPNAVVITFDDGYESFYKYAYPLLVKYNMPATNFVITSWVENYTPSGKELNSLGPEQIEEMYKSGLIDIQSHSHDGHDYIVRNEKGQTGGKLAFQVYDKSKGEYEAEDSYNKRVVDDLAKSVVMVEKYTGEKSDMFCFPFGHYNSRLVRRSREAGLKYFITTAYGYNKENSQSNMIKRIRSGDAKLSPEKLNINIINCGQGKPVTQ